MKKKTIIGFVTFTVILLLAAGVYVLKHNKKEALTVINYGELGNISMDNNVQATVIVLMSVILIRLPYLDKRSIMSSKYCVNI